MVRVSHRGKPTSFYTGYKINPKHWDGKNKRVNPRVSGAEELNRNIGQIKDNLVKVVRDLEYKGPASLEDVRSAFLATTRPEKKKTGELGDIILQFQRDRDDLAMGTLYNYSGLRKKIEAYGDAPLSEIDMEYVEGFSKFLRTTLTNNTVSKMLAKLKGVLNWARSRGEQVMDTKQILTPSTDKEVIFLTWDELVSLWDYNPSPGLQPSLDMYLFSCFTGMRLSDVLNFNPDSDIKEDFIFIRQIKTRDPAMVPLNKYSRELISRGIPKLTGQKVNENIKTIAERAGIDSLQKRVRWRGAERIELVRPKYEFLSFHTGRATFIMTHLAQGISAQGVMAMTGHTDYKSFSKYVRFSPDLLKDISKRVYG